MSDASLHDQERTRKGHPMASNQVSNQRSKSAGTQSRRKPCGDRATTEESKHEYGYMGAMAEQASDYVARGASRVRELTRDREGTAVAVALAAGIGRGLDGRRARWCGLTQQRSWRDRVAAEGFGRRLMDRIEGLIPDALAEHSANSSGSRSSPAAGFRAKIDRWHMQITARDRLRKTMRRRER